MVTVSINKLLLIETVTQQQREVGSFNFKTKKEMEARPFKLLVKKPLTKIAVAWLPLTASFGRYL